MVALTTEDVTVKIAEKDFLPVSKSSHIHREELNNIDCLVPPGS